MGSARRCRDGRHYCCFIIALAPLLSQIQCIVFEPITSVHVWITVSSLANKDPNNAKSLLFRQIELNWINAPLDDEQDYIALYLDNQPHENTLPVSVHRLAGATNGQIITDFYLPQIDFYNSTQLQQELPDGGPNQESNAAQATDQHQPSSAATNWFRHHSGGSRELVGRQGQLALSKPPSAGTSRLHRQCVGYCLAYHSRHKILAKNCLHTEPNWMRDSFHLIGARSLPTLMIPGTHNSATYSHQLDRSVLQIINKYQLNQDENIFNQLVYGVRHLDLRVGYSKVKQRSEKLWIYHDIFRTEVSANEVFEQVRRFLDLTSHEIIVMDFHRFTVGFQNEPQASQRERHAILVDLIFKHLGNYIIPSYLGLHAPLSEYVAMGKRLVVSYAGKASLFGPGQHNAYKLAGASIGPRAQPVRDIDAPKQDQFDTLDETARLKQLAELTGQGEDGERDHNSDHDDNDDQNDNQDTDSGGDGPKTERRVGTKLFNKLKSLKLISKSFSKRSIELRSPPHRSASGSQISRLQMSSLEDIFPATASVASDSSMIIPLEDSSPVARASLFFSSVRHLWPNKDTMEGLAHYMNTSACRKYFGELRSMMVELTPTVFGVISDKYDGNRRLAQLVNRQVSDSIRDRWLHCINIVASDFFLGNNLISLSIYANKMRVLQRDVQLSAMAADEQSCSSFRRIEHMLDKSKIPIQFAYEHSAGSVDPSGFSSSNSMWSETNGARRSRDSDVITHTSPNGHRIFLKPLADSVSSNTMTRERRDSFVENVSDGLTNLVTSFKRLFNL